MVGETSIPGKKKLPKLVRGGARCLATMLILGNLKPSQHIHRTCRFFYVPLPVKVYSYMWTFFRFAWAPGPNWRRVQIK